jgi:outer membrane protein
MLKGFLILGLTYSSGFSPVAIADGVNVTSANIRGHLEEKNAKISAARLEAEAAVEREGSLKRSFFPSIEVYGAQESFRSGTLSRKNQPMYGAEAKVNLYNGGRDAIGNEVRALETKKLGFQAQRIASEEIEKARSLYWEIVYLGEKVSLLKTTLAMNRQNLISAQRRIRSGVATDSDRFEFEMKEVDLKRDLAQGEIELAAQIRRLRFLLGLAEGTKILFTESLAHDHQYESLLKHSMKQHEFLFKDSEIQGEQYSLSAKEKKRAWWPKLYAFAAYYKYNERIESAGPGTPKDMRDETVLGLKLTMSLSAGFESNSEANALSKEARAANILSENKRQEIEANIENEAAELKFLHDQVHEAEENIGRAERYYRITQSEYARGVKNSPDVLGASEKLFDMRHKRLEIIKNFQVSKAHVLSKIGL